MTSNDHSTWPLPKQPEEMICQIKSYHSYLPRILGLEDYIYIIEHADDLLGTGADAERFKTTFNRFYRIRRDEVWRKNYYSCFKAFLLRRKANPNDIPSFEEILRAISISGSSKSSDRKNIEASFASKMLATLDPDKPIWDSNIKTLLKRCGEPIVEPTGDFEDRLPIAVENYERLETFYDKLKADAYAQELAGTFDDNCQKFVEKHRLNQQTKISDTKKIDFMLWAYAPIEEYERNHG